MSITLQKAICLHAQADDLKFLNPVRNRLGKLLAENFRSFSFGDQKSHAEARLGLAQAQSALVVVFAHGSSDYLRGGEYVDRVSREIVEAGKFLTKEEAYFFRDKVVFCMSCDSNGLAQASLDAGAKAFIGFGDIPFRRYDSGGNAIKDHEFEHHAQQLIARAIQAAMERFVTGRATLEETVSFLRLRICQEVLRFVRVMTTFKNRREVAALVLRIKDGVRYHGMPEVVFTK